MKGLMKYDLMQIGSGLKGGFFVVYFLLMAVFNALSSDGNMFSYILIFISSMFGISAFTYEETYRWNRYTATLPVSTRQIVLARYLVIGIFILGGVGASLLLGAISVIAGTMQLTAAEWMLSMLECLIVCILYQEIILPIMYRFGADRGRIVMMLFFIILFGVLYAAVTLIDFVPLLTMTYSFIITGAVVIVLFPISVVISIRIRAKKEF